MSFANFAMLFALLPLLLLYKSHNEPSKQTKLFYLALVFAIIALARPILEEQKSRQHFEAKDCIIALDASYSMQASDIPPNRFEASKETIAQLLKLDTKDRFTLFAFTSNALLLSPPTTDHAIIQAALDTLNPHYILTKSTNLFNLFQTVASMHLPSKTLLLFSDGGDLNQNNLAKILHLIKQQNIKLFFIKTATNRGSILQKDGVALKDSNGALVVSRLNPLVKALCQESHTQCFDLNQADLAKRLFDAISSLDNSQKIALQTTSYKELYFYPLTLALLLFFLAVTKLHQLTLLLVLLLPYKSEAYLLDFFYIYKAQKECAKKEYTACARSFSQVSPSVSSRYNEAVALYKAGLYKEALHLFRSLQTTDPKLKQKLLYNIANSYAKLQNYTLAREYYVRALGLGYDKDAVENLHLLQQHFLQTKKLPIHKNIAKTKQKRLKLQLKQSSQKAKNGKKSPNSSHEANSGAGGEKQKSYKTQKTPSKQHKKEPYKMSYKAYELINKGYADEKEPW